MLTSNKKNIKIIMLIFCILAFYCIKSNAVVKPTTNFYVNDYANRRIYYENKYGIE